jgi:hypothetical protein
VRNQIHEDASHAIINRSIDHLLAVARGAKKAAGAQHAQVMAYKTARQFHTRRDFADGRGFGETSEKNPQAAWFAQKTQQLGDLR